eukprot:2450824-Amphidinium_carterae.1
MSWVATRISDNCATDIEFSLAFLGKSMAINSSCCCAFRSAIAIIHQSLKVTYWAVCSLVLFSRRDSSYRGARMAVSST